MIVEYLDGLLEAIRNFLIYVLPLAAIWWLINRLRELKRDGFLGHFLISGLIYFGLGFYGTYWLHSKGGDYAILNLVFWSVVYMFYEVKASSGRVKKSADER